MSESEKFLRMFGGIFFAIGTFVGCIGIGLIFVLPILFPALIVLFLGIVFGSIGGGILLVQIRKASKRKRIEQEGVIFTGKIYGYVEDKSMLMNGDYLINIKVHYFDKGGIEREAIIPTGFARGSGDYPIGATIDIIALDSAYSWVKGSVRYEHIYGEEELMDNKPLDPSKLDKIAVSCPHCGASFSAARGYVGKCPYCGGVVNC